MPASDHEFCPGESLRIFPPNEKAASFILLTLLVNPTEMIEWLSKKDELGDEHVRLDVRVTDPARSFAWPTWTELHKPYITVNNWKPKPRVQEGEGNEKPF
jgi:hypothetical protein